MSIDREGVLVDLFAQHARALKKYLLSIVSKSEVAEDLTQDAFVRLQASGRSELDSPRGFLFRTARNLALDHLRRAGRVPMDALDDTAAAQLADAAASPEEQVAAREELAIMRTIILELPPKCRQAFLLVRLEGLSHREVAAEMGLSQTMVRKHLARALGHIQARLAGGIR
jgi:RNA polymerase sigma-70 factor (ECF subfamily)